MTIQEQIEDIIGVYYDPEWKGGDMPKVTQKIQSLIDSIMAEITSDKEVPNVMIAAEHASQRIKYQKMKEGK